MTFDEYNTDEYFNNKDSTADGLVKAAFDEGKTREEVENSLSPLWKEDKKGNVKKALDNYYKPKTEDKPAEEKTVEEVVAEETGTPEQTELKSKEKSDTAQSQNEISMAQEDFEKQRVINNKNQDWDNLLDTNQRRGAAFKTIDDHYLEGLPTFIFRRYQNDEFGDLSTPEGKKDAKLRMAYFMINGVGTALQNASAAIKGGAQQQSDIEKLKESQMTNAIQNRWEKNRQDTQSAINLAVKEAENEQEIYDAAARISSNNRLQSAFNRMNEEQKVYTLEVMAKIGDKLGNMNDDQFANTLFGFAAMGDKMDKEELAAMLVYRFGKKALSDPSVKNWLESFGINLDDIDDNEKPASVGGSGNLKNYKTIDGDNVDFNMIFTKGNGGKEKLMKLTQDLSDKYYSGEIDEETFRKYYQPLYEEGKKHASVKVFSADDVIKANNKKQIDDTNAKIKALNDDAKAGNISTADYTEKYNALEEKLKGYGATKIEKRLDNKAILKAVEKKNKKR